MSIVGGILYWVLSLYLLVLIARAVVSYVPLFNPGWRPSGATAVVLDVVYRLTDPLIRPLDRRIPPIRIGQVMIQLGFPIVLIVVLALRQTALSL